MSTQDPPPDEPSAPGPGGPGADPPADTPADTGAIPPPFKGYDPDDPDLPPATPGSVTGELMFAPGERITSEEAICVQCSYAIVGLVAGGHCPECGTPLERSLRGRWLRYGSPEYLARIRRGILIVLITLVAQVVLPVVVNIGMFSLNIAQARAGAAAFQNPATTGPAAGGTATVGTAVPGLDLTINVDGDEGAEAAIEAPAADSPIAPPAAPSSSPNADADQSNTPDGAVDAPLVASPDPVDIPDAAATPTAPIVQPPTAVLPGPGANPVANPGAAPGGAVVNGMISALSLVNYLMALAAALASFYGWWLVTTPDPGLPVHDNGGVPRRLVRWSVGAVAVASLLDFAAADPNLVLRGGGAGFGFIMITSIVLGVFSYAATVARVVASMLYLKWLAARFPDHGLVKTAGQYSIALPLIHVLGTCLCYLGPFVAGVMAWLLLFKAHSGLRTIAAIQESDVAAADLAPEGTT